MQEERTETGEEVLSVLTGKSILVTGGTGSFGHAFVKRALADGARRVVVFSRDELKQAQMKAEFPDERMRFFVGDVRDRERLDLAMKGIDLVVHAAAMKRIETCEADPGEAVLTNVIGTQNVALAAINAGVQKAVLLSTDKAPAAHTLYGATKFCAERLWIQSNVYAAGTDTKLSATRYGNVLGSRGSVLDIFRKQAENGLPLQITDAKMSRFWMTIEQAVALVVLALIDMKGGEVYVPKVPSAQVLTLATAVGAISGYIETGLRGSERLHETLISPDEARVTWDCQSHYVIYPESPTWAENVYRTGKGVPDGFSYRSDTNPLQLDVQGMRELIAA